MPLGVKAGRSEIASAAAAVAAAAQNNNNSNGGGVGAGRHRRRELGVGRTSIRLVCASTRRWRSITTTAPRSSRRAGCLARRSGSRPRAALVRLFVKRRRAAVARLALAGCPGRQFRAKGPSRIPRIEDRKQRILGVAVFVSSAVHVRITSLESWGNSRRVRATAQTPIETPLAEACLAATTPSTGWTRSQRCRSRIRCDRTRSRRRSQTGSRRRRRSPPRPHHHHPQQEQPRPTRARARHAQSRHHYDSRPRTGTTRPSATCPMLRPPACPTPAPSSVPLSPPRSSASRAWPWSSHSKSERLWLRSSGSRATASSRSSGSTCRMTPRTNRQ